MRFLEEVVLSPEEWEALKLHGVEGLKQREAARKMKISQPTFQRTLNSAYKKIAKALAEGKAIRIEERD